MIKRYILIQLAMYLTVFPLIIGCDAPRDNPLDPGSTTYVLKNSEDNLPVFHFFQVRTERIGATLPDPVRTTAIAEAIVTDADSIDRVYLEVADSLRYLMPFDASKGKYRYTFKPEQTGYSIYNFIGASFYVIVYDRKGHVARSDREMITRVLSDIPEPVSPILGETTGIFPTLIWSKYFTDYDITYSVEVRSPNATQHFFREGIFPEPSNPPDSLHFDSVRVDTELAEGEYRWNISVYDMLGNMSQSPTNIFRVEDTGIEE